MIKIKCEICKIDFLVPASHAKRRRFCSIKCKGIFQKGKPFFDSTGIPSWNKGKKNHYPAFFKGKKLPDLIKKKISKTLMGNKNAFNNGIRYLNGYVHIYSPEHPFKGKHKTVAEHRLVMERHIGRYLTKVEVVHHIDGNKLNNDISNLMLFPNNKEHMLHHGKMGTIKGRPVTIKM